MIFWYFMWSCGHLLFLQLLCIHVKLEPLWLILFQYFKGYCYSFAQYSLKFMQFGILLASCATKIMYNLSKAKRKRFSFQYRCFFPMMKEKIYVFWLYSVVLNSWTINFIQGLVQNFYFILANPWKDSKECVPDNRNRMFQYRYFNKPQADKRNYCHYLYLLD